MRIEKVCVATFLLLTLGLSAAPARGQARAEKPMPTGAAAPERAIRALDAS